MVKDSARTRLAVCASLPPWRIVGDVDGFVKGEMKRHIVPLYGGFAGADRLRNNSW